MSMLTDAKELAKQIHKGQFRRDNKTPYFNHVQSVVDLVKSIGGTEDQIIIAYLHDSIEESPKENRSALELEIEKKFGSGILSCILLLSKNETNDYHKYLQKLKSNKDALIVKICDIISNLSDDPTEKQRLKYTNALLFFVR